MARKKWIIEADPLTKKGPKGDKGDPGDGSELVLPISSDDVEYLGDTLTDVLASLLYVDLVIGSFTAATTNYEKGQVLVSCSFSWTLNKTIQSQTITGTNVTPPALLVGDRTKVVTLVNISTNTVVTLTVDDVDADAHLPKTATVTLTFLNKLYWGKAVIPGAVNSAFVLGLSNNELKSNRTKSFSLSPGVNEYIWFALPTAYGLPSFLTNGFSGGFVLDSTFNLTNASGYVESYRVYRSVNHSLGLTLVDIT